MIVYTCPKCGENLASYVIATFPPINVMECRRCGWRHEDNLQNIMYIPFPAEGQDSQKKSDENFKITLTPAIVSREGDK